MKKEVLMDLLFYAWYFLVNTLTPWGSEPARDDGGTSNIGAS